MNNEFCTPNDVIVVSETASHSGSLVASSAAFLALLRKNHLKNNETSIEARMSESIRDYEYYVLMDGYDGFVENFDWAPASVTLLKNALQAVGAHKHLDLLDQCLHIVSTMNPQSATEVISTQWSFGDVAQSDSAFSDIEKQFLTLNKQENLSHLNETWLKNHPKLYISKASEIDFEVERRAAHAPEIEQRRKAHQKRDLIYRANALCAKAGFLFIKFTEPDISLCIENGLIERRPLSADFAISQLLSRACFRCETNDGIKVMIEMPDALRLFDDISCRLIHELPITAL